MAEIYLEKCVERIAAGHARILSYDILRNSVKFCQSKPNTNRYVLALTIWNKRELFEIFECMYSKR